MIVNYLIGSVLCGAPVVFIVACIVCNSAWYRHRAALRDIRYDAELRRARRLYEIEEEEL